MGMNTMKLAITRRLIPGLMALGLIASTPVVAQHEPAVVNRETTGITDSTIDIGSGIPLSGLLKARGEDVTAGANLYFSYINDHGGIFGRKIRLLSYDDHYDPDQAIALFNEHLKGKVFAGFLFIGSAPIDKYVRMADVNQMPMLGFCTGAPIVYEFRPTIFTIRPSYSDEVSALIDHLCRVHSVRRVGIIYQSDAFGAAIRSDTERELSHHQLTPVVESSYARDATQLADAFNSAHQASPDCVILGAVSSKLLYFLQKKQETNWKTLFAAFSVATDVLLANTRLAGGTVVAQAWPAPNPEQPTIALYDKLRAKYLPGSKSNLSQIEGMVNAMVFVEGLKRAGKDLTRSKFVSALETLRDFDLGIGPNYKVTFTKSNHNGLNSKSVYCGVVKNGTIAALTNEEWQKLKH